MLYFYIFSVLDVCKNVGNAEIVQGLHNVGFNCRNPRLVYILEVSNIIKHIKRIKDKVIHDHS